MKDFNVGIILIMDKLIEGLKEDLKDRIWWNAQYERWLKKEGLKTSVPILPAAPSLQDVERVSIMEALQKCQNNKTHAAKLLGIRRNTLYLKLAKHGIV